MSITHWRKQELITYNIERCNDRERIEDILFHPDVVSTLLPFSDLKRGDKRLFEQNIQFYLWTKNDVACGAAFFLPYSDYISEADVAVLPEIRGKIAYKFGKNMVSYYFLGTKCDRIIVNILNSNKKSLCYALAIGFKITNRSKNDTTLEVTKDG